MLAKLEDIAARYDELEDQLSRPETLADMQLYTKLSREHAETEELVQTYRTYRRTESEMNAALAEAGYTDYHWVVNTGEDAASRPLITEKATE